MTMHFFIKCCVVLCLILASRAQVEEREEPSIDPGNTQANAFHEVKEDIEDLQRETESHLQSTNCACKRKLKQALIVALQGCVNVLNAEGNCSNRKKRAASINAEVMSSSCQCSDKAIKSLTDSLKSCTDAVGVCTSINYTSCEDIKRNRPSSPSGYYNIAIKNNHVRVYCNMDDLCNKGSGWIRLGAFDMTISSNSCPSQLQLYTVNNVRMCGRKTAGGGACASIMIPSNSLQYSQVCGRIRGYQRYTTDGIHHSHNINQQYVEGVSITRGTPRKHIWSLISGYSESHTDSSACPCNTGASSGSRPPSFVGNDYYCESGAPSGPPNQFITADPLWDKKLCRNREGPCCTSPLLPWFYKSIGTTTTDNIEMRVCTDEGTNNENVAIDQYEIYVK